MSEQLTEIKQGPGYTAASLDALGDGPGFRKIRKELGVSEFGVNAIVLPPGIASGAHWHDEQEELYFVHSGTVTFTLGENDEENVTLGAGGLLRVDPATPRSVRNDGPEDAVYVIVGAKGGYVGRDGRVREGDDRVSAVHG